MQLDPRIGLIDNMIETNDGIIVGSIETGLVSECTVSGKIRRDAIECREENDPPLSAMVISRLKNHLLSVTGLEFHI